MDDILDVIDRTNPGKHSTILHGDPERTGVLDRWYWSCRCGAGSDRKDMTMVEALADGSRHEETD